MNQHTEHSSRRLVRVAVVAAILAAAALAPATSAAPLERGHYSGTDSWDDDGCGFPIHGEATFEGVFMLKQPRTDGAPPYLFDNYNVVVTLTANGRTITIRNQGLYKDLRITHVDGTVYQFVSIEAGQPFVAIGDDSTVLFHDRGLVKTGFMVDTLGDADLDNDVLIEGSFELLLDAGRHPAFHADTCPEFEAYFFG
jgi:hypothetical protein